MIDVCCERMLKISEAANLLQCTEDQLRYLHRKKRLVPQVVLPSGHRRYSEKQILEFKEKATCF